MSTYEVQESGTYGGDEGGRFHFNSGDVIDLRRAALLGMAGAMDRLRADEQRAYRVELRRATWLYVLASPLGDGTGVIPDGTRYTEAGSDAADHIVTLPHPASVESLHITNGGAYELRSHDPATVAINTGTGADAESAIPIGSHVVCVSYGDEWGCSFFIGGSAVEAAAP